MSVDQVNIVNELKQKIRLLSEKIDNQSNNYTKLKTDNASLSQKVSEQEKEISELKQQNNTLRLKKAFSPEGEESAEAKMQINKIVREIDKCIALLNR